MPLNKIILFFSLLFICSCGGDTDIEVLEAKQEDLRNELKLMEEEETMDTTKIRDTSWLVRKSRLGAQLDSLQLERDKIESRGMKK